LLEVSFILSYVVSYITVNTVNKHKWMQHIRRMDTSRRQYAVMRHQPAGQMNPGRPVKGLPDCYTETGTGHGARSWQLNDDDDDDDDGYLINVNS
jgi:hypothetical protein